MLLLSYVDELLTACKDAFVEFLRAVAPAERSDVYPCASFGSRFGALHSALEQAALDERKAKTPTIC